MSGNANLKPYPKGVSGNPGGRPKGIAALAKQHAEKAIEVLAAGLEDKSPKVRIAAAKELLDRGFGKPLTMTADLTDKLDDLSDESLDAAIAVLRSAIGPSKEAGETKNGETQH